MRIRGNPGDTYPNSRNSGRLSREAPESLEERSRGRDDR